MENLNLGDLYLSKEESKDVIEFLAKKRNIKNYKSKSSDKSFKAIREELKDLNYKLPRSELKEIKKNLYNIEKRNKFKSKRTSKYLDELDKKILKLDKYHYHDDYEYRAIKNIKDLFKL